MAQEKAEEKGISVRESKRQVDLELFLDEYPQWNASSAGATRAVYMNLILEQTNLPWNW